MSIEFTLLDQYKNIESYCAHETSISTEEKSNILNFECDPFINIKWKNEFIKTKIIGDYNGSNIAAAITIANHFKIKDEIIYNSLKGLVDERESL